MEQNKVTRSAAFDILKALGIIAIVLNHSGSNFASFSVLFSVTLFFVVAGYFLKEKHYSDFKSVISFILKKVKTLALPFIILNLTLLCFHNYFCSIDIYTTNPKFLNDELLGFNNHGLIQPITNFMGRIFENLLLFHGEQLAGPAWFLRALFWLSVSFCLVSFVLKKLIKNEKLFEITRCLISIICLIIGFILQKIDFNFYSIGTMFSSFICLEIGVLYKKIENKIPYSPLVFIMCSFIIYLCYKVFPQNIISVSNTYSNPIGFVVCAFVGFLACLALAAQIEKIEILSKIFSYVGKRTLVILCLHILFFKFYTIYLVYHFGLESYYRAAFPILTTSNYDWVIYLTIGILGPLFVNYIYVKFKNKISKLFLE